MIGALTLTYGSLAPSHSGCTGGPPAPARASPAPAPARGSLTTTGGPPAAASFSINRITRNLSFSFILPANLPSMM